MNSSPSPAAKPPVIGVFDSGFGGLTVLRELLTLIPNATYVYLGDTARLPYGSKSRATISRYTLSSAQFLIDQGAELLVIACNTASALALDDLRAALTIPVIGVIEPGAEAALAASTRNPAASGNPDASDHPAVSHDPDVIVLATAATVQSHAYSRALHHLGLPAIEQPCPILVPLVEENWLDPADPARLAVTLQTLHIYLTEALRHAPRAHTLLLGCTHYPLLQPLIQQTLEQLRHPMRIIDSAHAVAAHVAPHIPSTPASSPPELRFFATDSVEKFARLGSLFLGRPLTNVQLVDLGG